MHSVKNVSQGQRSLWARQADGDLALEWLDSGEIRKLNVDPADPAFAGGDFKIVSPEKPAASKAKPKTKRVTATAPAHVPAPEPTPET